MAEIQPSHSAIVSAQFEPLSYEQLHRLIDNTRDAFDSFGLGKNSRVAVALPSNALGTLGIVATSCSSVGIPINPRQSSKEIEYCFNALGVDAIVLMKGIGSAARDVARTAGIHILEVAPLNDGALDFEFVEYKAGSAKARADEADLDPTLFILQTSGTAAEPKLIPFGHRNMLAAAARLQAWFDLTSQDRCLSVSSPFYSHGLKVTVFTPLLTGGSVAFPTDASRFNYAEWFEDLRPTWYSAGPTQHRLILDQTKSRTDANTGHSLRFILSGGAPIPRDVLVGLQDALDTPVVEHYGSSEAAQIAANLPRHSKLGTCGVPWPGTVRIVGPDGYPVKSGERGEILVGGPTLISGYLGAQNTNRVAFDNGWFKTGDIGSIDEEGFLTLHGRMSDIINRGGEKISPNEVDEALLRHPAVAEAAAFSVPHSRLGEDVAAAVVLRPNMTATSVALRKFLQDHLAPFKIPRQIIFREELPKGTTGKVLRRRLTELLAVGERTASSSNSEQQKSTPPVGTLAEQVTTVWERLLKSTPIYPDDNFFDKGGDSLLAMQMLSELERLTGQIIPSSILFEATSIRQLLDQLSLQSSLEGNKLIEIGPVSAEAPIFFFHGDYNGGGHYATKLAKLLRPAQSLVIIVPHGADGDAIPPSIQSMAADRARLIVDKQPNGPYRLCGYCVGGLVAFEVARMLSAKGEKVEFVGMIDSPTINALPLVQLILRTMRQGRPLAPSTIDSCMIYTWNQLTKLGAASEWPYHRRIAHKLLRLFRITSPTKASRESPLGVTVRDQQYALALCDYFPKPLDVPVVYYSADYEARAWKKICKNVIEVTLPSDHFSIITDPALLAKHLATHLSR